MTVVRQHFEEFFFNVNLSFINKTTINCKISLINVIEVYDEKFFKYYVVSHLPYFWDKF